MFYDLFETCHRLRIIDRYNRHFSKHLSSDAVIAEKLDSVYPEVNRLHMLWKCGYQEAFIPRRLNQLAADFFTWLPQPDETSELDELWQCLVKLAAEVEDAYAFPKWFQCRLSKNDSTLLLSTAKTFFMYDCIYVQRARVGGWAENLTLH